MSVNVTEIFGSNVFSTAVMRERLPKGVFQEVMDVMKHGGPSCGSACPRGCSRRSWT